ncbi:MAG: Restriction endonuclease NotI [Subtercola sp.]|nr:Restriction endonuclease NotI [Subtercola sp.]
MAGTIWEFFGYRADDTSPESLAAAENRQCPFLGATCEKKLHDSEVSGACTIKPVTSGPVICCPIRLYADDYRILRDVADKAFGAGISLSPGRKAVDKARETGLPTVAVFGKRWGGELRLPQKDGTGAYFVDWMLALLDGNGELVEFVAIEVQTIDTTGNYRNSRTALLSATRDVVKSTVGLNWENVSKRILPQLVFKGQLLQREPLCKKGLFFVCPSPVYERIIRRLGGESVLPSYALQPPSITFMAYDHDEAEFVDGEIVPIELKTDHSTTIYKLQEAFNNVTLSTENVYRDAILTALGS